MCKSSTMRLGGRREFPKAKGDGKYVYLRASGGGGGTSLRLLPAGRAFRSWSRAVNCNDSLTEGAGRKTSSTWLTTASCRYSRCSMLDKIYMSIGWIGWIGYWIEEGGMLPKRAMYAMYVCDGVVLKTPLQFPPRESPEAGWRYKTGFLGCGCLPDA